MRVRLAAILVVLALIILVARKAHAYCGVDEAILGHASLPAGCKLEVYLRRPDAAVKVVALRGGQRVDVTGAIATQAVSVPLFIETNQCTGDGMTSSHAMTLASIELKDVVAGDTLELEGVTVPRTAVTAAATCTAPTLPSLFCADDMPPFCVDDDHEDDDGGGCSVGGTPALGAALLLLGLTRRRRR